MELIATTIFSLAIIVAVWKNYSYNLLDLKVMDYVSRETNREYKEIKNLLKQVQGELEKQRIRNKVLEKFAERAWNTANAASLGVVALQKAQIAKPRIRSYNQAIHDQVAEKKLDEIFEGDDRFAYLEPFANEEELELIDKIKKQTSKM